MATQPQPVSPQLDPVRVFAGFASETAAPRSTPANPADLGQLPQAVRDQRFQLWDLLQYSASGERGSDLSAALIDALLLKHDQSTSCGSLET
jgi:hypothetical protein